MKDYLKQFETIGKYESWLSSNNYIEPSVSHTLDNDVVHYQPITQAHDYSDYLTFEAIEPTTFSFSTNNLQYSLDNGSTWTTLTAGNSTPQLSIGDKILWKQTGLIPTANYGIGTFSSTGKFNVSGNIMSLYYGDDFVSQTDLTGKNYVFTYLFKNCSKLVNSENLILPAIILADYCYEGMFQGCTSLTIAPELPATTLANNCYSSMFCDCTSLTTAPELPATILADYCYSNMFEGCTSLTSAPELPVTTLTDYCYIGMFISCTSLITAPELPATILANACYENMFKGCTSLANAPELPATTLKFCCYDHMFEECTSLTSAPELPATTLANYCYRNMFIGCTSLTTAPTILPTTALTQNCYWGMFVNCTSLTIAPELPAITLTNSCYKYMFSGCTSLNYIKCLATDISATDCTTNWVNGVSSTGTFVKDASMSSWTTGNNGIPKKWTVQDAA